MQTTKLKLILTEPDIVVPDTGNQGRFTGSINGTSSIIAVLIAIVLLTAVFGLVIHKVYKNKTKENENNKINKTKTSLIAIALIVMGLFSAIFAPLAINNNSNTFATDDYATIEVPEETELEGEIAESAFIVNKVTITKIDATNFGYDLYAKAGDTAFIPETEGNETIIDTISEPGRLTDNSYGFTLESDAKADDEAWYPIASLGDILKSYTASTVASNVTDVYFGALINDGAISDTYTLDVDFYAINKPANISNLVFMQGFAKLSDEEMDAVKASMTPNGEYILKDSRDNKEYYITKLADGNVWMTQNLDHDITTEEDYYTSDNTDIPTSISPLTMDTATYAAGDTTWNGYETKPESYDPGNLCWNGVIREDWDGTLDNSTIPCTDASANKHYSLGNYYNWTAMIAMNDDSSYDIAVGYDVNQSICPAGWRLPTYEGNKSYQNLVTSLSLTAGVSGNVHTAPMYFVYGGTWYGDMDLPGSGGNYMTSVIAALDGASYMLSFGADGDLSTEYQSTWDSGLSVRCVVRD